MPRPYPCRCCSAPLEPVQQFRFLVETATLDDPAHLALIRALPSAGGRPLPVCKACQARFEADPRAVSRRAPLVQGLLGALGVLSVGLLFGHLLAPRG